ncbi:MAG: MFS transporter [Candidatus Saccharibacteria bacterium]
MKKWLVVIVLSLAQFIMVLDSTVMNVSISEIVADLNTTVAGLQVAITFFTLVMAAMMLTGGKIGDILGRLKTFKYGLLIYGIGALITSLSVSLPMLIFGWSFIEGLGAVLVIPAVVALVAANYEGKDRVVAYSILGAVSGAAAAAGPLIGGAVTTYLSWRYVFAFETIIVLIILFFFASKIKDIKIIKKPTLDKISVMLSATGIFFIVFAILQSKTWGWIDPMSAPMINGHEFTPFGYSVVPFMIAIGIGILWFFFDRQIKLKKDGKSPLLDVSMLKVPALRTGLANITIQYLITGGLFFVLPVYLQMSLGLDALSTGLKILPLSFALVVFSLLGARLVGKYSPKRIIVMGKYLIIAGICALLFSMGPEIKDIMFQIGMFLVGGGMGLMASQIGNVILSSVEETQTSEAGGLQGTFQNLGSSFGTAVIGSVLIASLTTGFITSATDSSSVLPDQVKTYISDNSKAGISVVNKNEIYNYSIKKGLSKDEANEVTDYYMNAQMASLKKAMLTLLFLALMGLLFSKGLPEELIKK